MKITSVIRSEKSIQEVCKEINNSNAISVAVLVDDIEEGGKTFKNLLTKQATIINKQFTGIIYNLPKYDCVILDNLQQCGNFDNLSNNLKPILKEDTEIYTFIDFSEDKDEQIDNNINDTEESDCDGFDADLYDEPYELEFDNFNIKFGYVQGLIERRLYNQLVKEYDILFDDYSNYKDNDGILEKIYMDMLELKYRILKYKKDNFEELLVPIEIKNLKELEKELNSNDKQTSVLLDVLNKISCMSSPSNNYDSVDILVDEIVNDMAKKLKEKGIDIGE